MQDAREFSEYSIDEICESLTTLGNPVVATALRGCRCYSVVTCNKAGQKWEHVFHIDAPLDTDQNTAKVLAAILQAANRCGYNIDQVAVAAFR